MGEIKPHIARVKGIWKVIIVKPFRRLHNPFAAHYFCIRLNRIEHDNAQTILAKKNLNELYGKMGLK